MPIRYDFSAQRSFEPYPEDILPEGFQYPKGYLAHSREMLYPVQFPWWFDDSSKEAGASSWRMRSHWKIHRLSSEDIDPIPFARNGELAAFFDGKDHSGDPPVFVVHLPTSACVSRYDCFEAWLDAGKKESGIGEPPYDKVTADPAYPIAAEHSDEYYFCPNCYEPNHPIKEYDDAIRCVNCDIIFNLR